MKCVVEGQGLMKKYEDKWVFQDLNLSIPEQRIIGILGPNGVGKSTLFRLIMGFTQPDDGKLEVLGRKPGWETYQDISYLPDRARWYADHTVQQALEWGEQFLSGFRREMAEKLLEMMQLKPEMKVQGMSKGEEARLMLVLCLARQVPLILLDEPLSGIDLVSREKIIAGILEQVSEYQQTILMSTHEIAETEGLFDYALFLGEGKVMLAGDVEEIRREHGSLQTVYRKLYS